MGNWRQRHRATTPTAQDRFVADWLQGHELSPEARTLLDAGQAVYRLFYAKLAHLRTGKFKIDTWDAGWWQVRSALKDRGCGLDDMRAVKQAHDALRDKLRPELASYGFMDASLLPAVAEHAVQYTSTEGGMEMLGFLAGMQAIAAFLQVWQGERNVILAREAYFREKERALADPAIQEAGRRLGALIAMNPRTERILTNRIGRCEDVFEERARNDATLVDDLPALVDEFNRCKCMVMEAIRRACGGELPEDLKPKWEALACEAIIVGNEVGK
jgi:hypothetical protein